MERSEFVELMAPFVLAMRAEFDQPTWAAYYRVLHDIPAMVFSATVDALSREPLEFFPKAGEFRAAAEKQRRMLLATKPHLGCVECEDSKGWRKLNVAGALTVDRCPCVARHREVLDGLGLVTPIAKLPGEEAADDETIYPTLAQLPEVVRTRLLEIANQKQLR